MKEIKYSKRKLKNEIKKLNMAYDMDYRGGTGRGEIDEEFVEILAVHFIGHLRTNGKYLRV